MELGDAHCGGKSAAVTCSICLDAVTDDGVRSWATLQCAHKFHLDCIGSAFNAKGAMECPNCRKIEKGKWLYANGSQPWTEFNMEDWALDEDVYEMSSSEMSSGVHWCPINGLTRLPTSFDEAELQSSAYHDLLGHHPLFSEQAPVSSTPHPCPYVLAYLGPLQPTSSASNGNLPDGSGFNNHWNGPGSSAATQVPTSYPFPYPIWDHVPRSGMHHPLIAGHTSPNIPSSALPPPIARPRPPSHQVYYQQGAAAD